MMPDTGGLPSGIPGLLFTVQYIRAIPHVFPTLRPRERRAAASRRQWLPTKFGRVTPQAA